MMNIKPEATPITGEDGELLQPDASADNNAYADYVATYVRRDPLWFRAWEHIKDYWLGYLICVPGTIFVGLWIIEIVATSIEDSFDGELARLSIIMLGIIALAGWLNSKYNKIR